LEESISQWKEAPTAGGLGDIISFSIDPELRPEIKQLIKADRRTEEVATVPQKAMIESLFAEEIDANPSNSVIDLRAQLGPCNLVVKERMSELRRVLRVEPRNTLALLDIAQLQLASGHTQRAERSVRSALALSPNSRLALRTLARLYVHQKNFDAAHALIYRHVRTPHDPWLMASEIALAEAAGAASRFAAKGFKFARDKQASAENLSELAGALGGIELKNGKVGRARDMFRLALEAPNDNVVAQAVTDMGALGISLAGPKQSRAMTSAHEAQTLVAWDKLDEENAELHGLLWHREEPFSSRPLQFLTTLYAAKGDYERAAMLSRRGLVADADDPALLANLSYVLASKGDLAGAHQVLLKMLSLKQEKYNTVALATAGLMAMQVGQWSTGDNLYQRAMESFRRSRMFDLEALCSAYYARSAHETGHEKRDAILSRAQELYQKSPTPDAAIVLNLLDRRIGPLQRMSGTRRLNQWIFDPKTESLIQVQGLTQPGAPPLIIKGI
jgi:tetratricopeptide (TPR) repeat protein